MTSVSVDFAAAEAALASLRTARSEIAARLAVLDGEVARLRGGWTGEAQQAYDAAQARWSVQMTKLGTLLGSACGVLEQWLADMKELERELAGMWPA